MDLFLLFFMENENPFTVFIAKWPTVVLQVHYESAFDFLLYTFATSLYKYLWLFK